MGLIFGILRYLNTYRKDKSLKENSFTLNLEMKFKEVGSSDNTTLL